MVWRMMNNWWMNTKILKHDDDMDTDEEALLEDEEKA